MTYPTPGLAARAGGVALVTGASRGIGREVCRELRGAGRRVFGGCRAPSAEDPSAPFEAVPLDVTDPASVAALAADLTARGVTLGALVNNAGIALDGFDAGIAERTLAVNYFGALAVTDALLPLLADGGVIVMVSSGMGETSCLAPALAARLRAPDLTRAELDRTMRGFVEAVGRGDHERHGFPSSAYRASKVGLNAAARVLARDLAPRRIRVLAVCPGWVRTGMGGPGAPRSVEEGARGVVWAVTAPDAPREGFFRDGAPIPW